jgi:hypothetical protein
MLASPPGIYGPEEFGFLKKSRQRVEAIKILMFHPHSWKIYLKSRLRLMKTINFIAKNRQPKPEFVTHRNWENHSLFSSFMADRFDLLFHCQWTRKSYFLLGGFCFSEILLHRPMYMYTLHTHTFIETNTSLNQSVHLIASTNQD